MAHYERPEPPGQTKVNRAGPQFRTRSVLGPAVTTVHVTGDLDLASYDKAVAAFGARDRRSIVVNLTELNFMDCCGYRSLLVGRDAAERCGATFSLVGAHGEPARLLSLLDELSLLRGSPSESNPDADGQCR